MMTDFKKGRALQWLLAASTLFGGATQAHAGFIWFNLVNNARPGMQVTVAEQIVCITAGACNAGNAARVLDYQYFVFNTGLFNVDGFAVGVGNRANAIAGGENTSNLAGGADLVFPAATGNGVTNQPSFLTTGGMANIDAPGQTAYAFPATGMTDIGIPAGGGWGFEEFDTAAGVAPRSYVTRWYTAAQGLGAGRNLQYAGGCAGAIPAANVAGTALANTDGMLNAPVVCGGGVWYFADRFDLYSSKSPVPGTGAPDPAGAAFFSFDDVINGVAVEADLDDATEVDVCTDCSSTGPTESDVQAQLPEPASTFLAGSGLIALFMLRRRSS